MNQYEAHATTPDSRKGEARAWQILGGGQEYRVAEDGRGVMTCNCPNARFRRKTYDQTCKHVAVVRDALSLIPGGS